MSRMPEIIICVTRRDGVAHAAELGRPASDFIFVTPRSQHGARGRNVAAVHETDDAKTHHLIEKLRCFANPALATFRR